MRSYIPIYVCLILAGSPAFSAPLLPPTVISQNQNPHDPYHIGLAVAPKPNNQTKTDNQTDTQMDPQTDTQTGKVGPPSGFHPVDLTTVLPRDSATRPVNNAELQDAWAKAFAGIKGHNDIAPVPVKPPR